MVQKAFLWVRSDDGLGVHTYNIVHRVWLGVDLPFLLIYVLLYLLCLSLFMVTLFLLLTFLFLLFIPAFRTLLPSPRPRSLLCWKTQAIGCGHICSVSFALGWESRTEFKLKNRHDIGLFMNTRLCWHVIPLKPLTLRLFESEIKKIYWAPTLPVPRFGFPFPWSA